MANARQRVLLLIGWLLLPGIAATTPFAARYSDPY